jgi:hypothetical protein
VVGADVGDDVTWFGLRSFLQQRQIREGMDQIDRRTNFKRLTRY